MEVLGYRIRDLIFKSDKSLIYSAYESKTQKPVILKILQQYYLSPQKIAAFKREYEITSSLHLPGVVEAYALKTWQQRPSIVLEDFNGVSLNKLSLEGKLDWPEFLSFAIKITDSLGQVHEQNVIHKDINPSNIVWNRSNNIIKIIDFGISTKLSREITSFGNPEKIEGTLAYISPEQTGRMNRFIDYRTDFYSLGVSFYELVTGQLPFLSNDPLELVHCHIAKAPLPPHVLRPDTPPALEQIILKLMAKNAEERYQSAFGLKADLERCQRLLTENEPLILPFIGEDDRSARFQISQKLYGREREIITLVSAFERASEGKSQIILISGYSGIGKSALVREVYKPITQRNGYFITGKFEQYQRDIPYMAIADACSALIRQLLGESREQIEAWREKILSTIGNGGRALIEIIPEIALIIGEQPPLDPLSAADSQNQFNKVFLRFISIFTRPEHPLTLFLDDLQWADRASLQLLELLITSGDTHHLLIIGAYRDNEVSHIHPLSLTIEEMKKQGVEIGEILLSPLALEDLTLLFVDTLKCEPEIARPLAQLVLLKTDGNPFFSLEFLKSLYKEELLSFDFTSGAWRWDLERIRQRNITDNVVELMMTKLGYLAENTRRVLRLAACIGNQFDVRTLLAVSERSVTSLAQSLAEAIEAGLVQPLDKDYALLEVDVDNLTDEMTVEYKFVHDRIQQAAYLLIPDSEKPILHLHIGQLLLRTIPPEERQQKIFDIVNHLNQGRNCLQGRQEIDELAQLNFTAGMKAKTSAAYQSAFYYLGIAIELLSQSEENKTWTRNYDFNLSLYLEATESASLSGNLQELELWSDTIIAQAKEEHNRLKAYYTMIRAYISQQQPARASQCGFSALKLLGVHLPSDPTLDDLIPRLEHTRSLWANGSIQSLIDLPLITDPTILETLLLLHITMVFSLFGGFSEELYFPLLAVELVDRLFQHGNAPIASVIYITYGWIVCAVEGDISSGYRFGCLGLALAQRFGIRYHQVTSLHVFNIYIRHWKHHLNQSLEPFIDVYNQGVETGELLVGCIALYENVLHKFWLGYELSPLHETILEFHQLVTGHQHELQARWLLFVRQLTLCLLGETDNPWCLNNDTYDETGMLQFYQMINDRLLLLDYYVSKLYLCYLFGRYEEALSYAEKTKDFTYSGAGRYIVPVSNFFQSLTLLAIAGEAEDRGDILATVNRNQTELKNWADHAPMNFLHKFYLVEAEKARITGDDAAARDYYDRAISLAGTYSYPNEEALAYELAGRFYLQGERSHLAAYYLQDAYYAYQQWGAVAKTKSLEAEYSYLLTRGEKQRRNIKTTEDSIETVSETLDFASIVKASQTVSREILLDRLLEQLMKIVLENAGAERGFLLLNSLRQEDNRRDIWTVAAEGSIDEELVNVRLTKTDASYSERSDLCVSVINYVINSLESIVLDDATASDQFGQDGYLINNAIKSVLCLPLLNQNQIIGLLYLENNLVEGAFTSQRIEVLNILSSQAAISLQNAQLYERTSSLNQNLLAEIRERLLAEEALKESNIALESARDQLSEYSKNLELKVQERTQELSQLLEVLKATQAELIFENALLREAEDFSGFNYQVGGSLPMDSRTYVVRAADRYLYKALKRQDFAYVLNARQMGKSSLMVRMMQQLQGEGYNCIAIDMTRIGSDEVTLEQWYKGIAVELWQGFGLLGAVSLKNWWNERSDLSAVQRLSRFIEDVLLVELAPQPLVIFIDEIDNILALNFSVHDFFAMIRSCYNQRSFKPEYRRLNFAFFGAASPSNLMSDIQRTPFNIGKGIELQGFKEHEAQPLVQGLSDKVTNPQTLLKSILGWTNGQPFLTQKLCQLIHHSPVSIPINQEEVWLEQFIEEKILIDWEIQDEPEHLRTIRDRLLKHPQAPLLLTMYQDILIQGSIPITDSILAQELLLSGIVIQEHRELKLHNRIYGEIFNREWVESHLHTALMGE